MITYTPNSSPKGRKNDLSEPILVYLALVVRFIWDSFQTPEGQDVLARGEALLNGQPVQNHTPKTGTSAMDTPPLGTPGAPQQPPNEPVSRFSQRG